MIRPRLLSAFALACCLLAGQPALAADFNYGQRLFSIGKYEEALAIWLPMAEAGDPRAQYCVALAYAEGFGVAPDAGQARLWAQRALDQGYAPAADLLATVAAAPAAQAPQPRVAAAAFTGDKAAVADAVSALLQEFFGNSSLQHDPMTIEQDGGQYRVALPALAIRSRKGYVVSLGTLQIAVATPDELTYAMTVQLPDTFRARDHNGDAFDIAVGRQDISLVWDRLLKTSSDFAIHLSDLAMKSQTQETSLTIGDLAAVSEIRAREGLWSGPLRFELSDIRLAAADATRGRIGRLAVRLDVERLDLPVYLKVMRGVRSAGDGERASQTFPEHMLDAATLSLSVIDVDLPGRDGSRMKLQDASLETGIRQQNDSLADVALKIGYTGLDLAEAMPGQTLQPRSLAADLALQRLPVRSAVYAALSLGIEAALFGEAASAEDVVPRLLQDLATANTVLAVNRIAVDGKDYKAAVSGALKPDASAAFGIVGNLAASVQGMAALLAQDAGNAGAQGFQGLLRQAQLLGEPASTEEDTLNYSVALDRDGRLTVNDQELMPAAKPQQQSRK